MCRASLARLNLNRDQTNDKHRRRDADECHVIVKVGCFDANVDRESWQHGTRLLHAREEFSLACEARATPDASRILGLTQGTPSWTRSPKGPRRSSKSWIRSSFGVHRSCGSTRRNRCGLLGIRVGNSRYARPTGLPTFHRVRLPFRSDLDRYSLMSDAHFYARPHIIIVVVIAAVVFMICIVLLAREGDIGS